MIAEGVASYFFPLTYSLVGKKGLKVQFENGTLFHYTAEFLRIKSPSKTLGHGSLQHTVVTGKKLVRILSVESVSNYAVRICFDDHQDIYSWQYLYELGERQEELWQRYLETLHSLGLTREG